LEGAKFPVKSNYTEEKKTANEAEAVFANNSKEKTSHRKHQQTDKKKKKKKQRQKENMKINEGKETPQLTVKGKEEIRREELTKAGVLAPANTLLRGKEKGEISKASKETSEVKSYLTKTSKDPPRSKIKGNSLQSLNSVNTQDRDKNKTADSNRTPIENGDKEWPNRQAQKDRNDHMSSIDSAIAYLSASEHPLDQLNTNKLSNPTKSNEVPGTHDWPESLKDSGTDRNRIDSWLKPAVDWRNRNNWSGSFSKSKSYQDMENSYRKPDEWARILSGSKSTHRGTHGNDFDGIPSRSIGKDTPESNEYTTWKGSETKFNNWPGLNPKEERRYYSSGPVYNSPNTGWPRFSVDSLKHGNIAGNVRTWPDIPLDQTVGSNKNGYNLDKTSDNWPKFPLETHIEIQNPHTYIWPNYSHYNENQNSIIDGKINVWSKPSLDSAVSKQTEMTGTWSQAHSSHQKPVSAIDSAIAHHTKEAPSSKQWPHFAYHRVTSSPQVLAQQQQEAQQRARHRNAYIAVSVIAPPAKNKALNKTQSRTNGSLLQAPENAHTDVNRPPAKPSAAPLPDKMDILLAMRPQKQELPDEGDLLEEELVDMAVMGQQERAATPWNHERHLDNMQVFVSFGTV
jgi:hypothetical protein